MVIEALQSPAHTRKVIASTSAYLLLYLRTTGPPTLHGIAQHHVVVRPTLDPDSMVRLIHSRAATPHIRIRGHNQIPQTGTT